MQHLKIYAVKHARSNLRIKNNFTVELFASDFNAFKYMLL